jgi:hypothetical protein
VCRGVWDTGLTLLALQEVNLSGSKAYRERAYTWLKTKQLSDEPGDWRIQRPNLAGGGWAFQFENPHYPDVDNWFPSGQTMSRLLLVRCEYNLCNVGKRVNILHGLVKL